MDSGRRWAGGCRMIARRRVADGGDEEDGGKSVECGKGGGDGRMDRYKNDAKMLYLRAIKIKRYVRLVAVVATALALAFSASDKLYIGSRAGRFPCLYGFAVKSFEVCNLLYVYFRNRNSIIILFTAL